jgi:beta-lactam-binding protein with PASTA domain
MAAGSATTSAVQAAYATPNLQGRTLAAAKALLQRAHMTLASVTKPKHVTQHHALHVVWQSTKAGSQHTAGCRVSIRFR